MEAAGMTTSGNTTLANDVDTAIGQFGEAQRRDGVQTETIVAFEAACRRFLSWLQANGQPASVDQITAGHVEEWEADLRRTMPHETFHDNHRALQQFLTWYGRQHDPDWRSRSAWRRAAVESPAR
jgi:hypothetical protein